MADEQDWLQSVRQFRQTGQHEEALHHCEFVLKREPENTTAMGFRAMLLYELNRLGEALKAYRTLAYTHAKQGDYLQALTAAKDVATLSPELSEKLTAELAHQYRHYQETQPILSDKTPTQDFPPFVVDATLPSMPSFSPLPNAESDEDEMVHRLLQLQEASDAIDTVDFSQEDVHSEISTPIEVSVPLPSLFRQLDPASTAAIWSSMETIKFSPKEIVIKQGEDGRSFFIIAEGTVRVTHCVDGEEEELGCLGAGQFFGEIALMTALKRTATVTTASDCKILKLERSAIESIILNHQNVHLELQRFVYQRLIHNLLISSLLFFPLSDIKRWELAQQFNVVEVSEKFKVLTEAEAADGLYLIAGGAVDLYRTSPSGEQRNVRHLGTGQFFGELPILTKTASPCSIVTTESTTFLKLNAEDFYRVLEQYPRVFDLLQAVAAKKSRELSLMDSSEFQIS